MISKQDLLNVVFKKTTSIYLIKRFIFCFSKENIATALFTASHQWIGEP